MAAGPLGRIFRLREEEGLAIRRKALSGTSLQLQDWGHVQLLYWSAASWVHVFSNSQICIFVAEIVVKSIPGSKYTGRE
jgi:hypothetical protein